MINFDHTTNNISASSGNLSINGAVPSAGGSSTKTIANKTAAYTVVAGDLGTIINCTSGTFTVSLTAAATLGSGFVCTIWNTTATNTNVITIDPNLSETIDGLATLILRRGEGLDIVCDGTNWQIDNKKPMRGYSENLINTAIRPISSGDASISLGISSISSGVSCFSAGYAATASGNNSLSIGVSTTASSYSSSAIGNNSTGSNSVATTGAGAMALGGSYASGTDSFAAAITNNTSTYGALGTNSIAIGLNNKSSGAYSVSLGAAGLASGDSSIALGSSVTATGVNSVVLGNNAVSTQNGKYTFANGRFLANGDAQFGKIVLRAQNSSTATILTSDGAAASTTNQLIVATGQSMVIQGTLIAKQSGNGNITAYNITGAVSNNGGILSSTGLALTLIGTDSIGLGAAPTIALDTVNKAVKITSGWTGAQTRYVATLNTTEVTFA